MAKKNERSRAAAESLAGNIHMLSEILLRVPLKPLVRLKCVSKQWLTLISDQHFRDSHSLHHQQHQCYPNSLVFSYSSHILSLTTTTTTTTPLPYLDFDFLDQTVLAIVRSCNGLLLCRGYNSTYFICNPITRDFTTLNLARHPCTRDRDKTIHLYLAFDPSIWPQYKVVSVAVSLSSPLECVFHVYTFRTRSRIGSAVSVSTSFALDAANGVYCNGAIHWCNEGGEFSVYFDVDTQRLKNYPMPMPLFVSNWFERDKSIIEYFGESGGRLHLMLSVAEQPHSFLHDLFELNQDYSGWSLMHRVDLSPMQVEFPNITWGWDYLRLYIVSTAEDMEKKPSMLVLVVGKEGAIFYDPVEKASRKLCDFETGNTSLPIWNSTWGGVLLHFENLVQPKDANGLS